MAERRATIIRGGRVVNVGDDRAEAADILINGDTIAEVGHPGLAAPADAVTIDARDRLIHPGLINAHMHGHGNLAKGMGDRWTLELLLTAAPWTNGFRSLEDKYLSTLIGAAEMLMKGCTACYDLMAEFPTPSVEGLEAVGRAYSDAGMRAVVAPMVADLSFFEAIPGLMEALPPPLQREVERVRLPPIRTSLEKIRRALHGWRYDCDVSRPAVAPTIPLHCSDDFLKGCGNLAREYGAGLQTHLSESKVQAVSALKRYGKSLAAHMDAIALVGPHL